MLPNCRIERENFIIARIKQRTKLSGVCKYVISLPDIYINKIKQILGLLLGQHNFYLHLFALTFTFMHLADIFFFHYIQALFYQYVCILGIESVTLMMVLHGQTMYDIFTGETYVSINTHTYIWGQFWFHIDWYFGNKWVETEIWDTERSRDFRWWQRKSAVYSCTFTEICSVTGCAVRQDVRVISHISWQICFLITESLYNHISNLKTLKPDHLDSYYTQLPHFLIN